MDDSEKKRSFHEIHMLRTCDGVRVTKSVDGVSSVIELTWDDLAAAIKMKGSGYRSSSRLWFDGESLIDGALLRRNGLYVVNDVP